MNLQCAPITLIYSETRTETQNDIVANGTCSAKYVTHYIVVFVANRRKASVYSLPFFDTDGRFYNVSFTTKHGVTINRNVDSFCSN